MLKLYNQFYPERTITLTSSEPAFVTPEIKSMLRRRNALMRSDRVEKATALTKKIGALIVQRNSTFLKHDGNRYDAKDMWAKVRQLTHRSPPSLNTTVTAAQLNDHFSSVSQDLSYIHPLCRDTVIKPIELVSEMTVFYLLDHLKTTAMGLDGLPSWFLKLSAPFIASHLSELFNLSISLATVPNQWKQALIVPIPKVAAPSLPSEFRPISITPILSRILEKIYVQKYLYPAFQLHTTPSQSNTVINFHKQFAFLPTGSTTAALIALLHAITERFNSEPFVRVISLDFSKAFDTVRHSTLVSKASQILPDDQALNWLVS